MYLFPRTIIHLPSHPLIYTKIHPSVRPYTHIYPLTHLYEMTRVDEPAAAVEHSGCWDGTATGSHTLSIWLLTHPSHTLHTPSQYVPSQTFSYTLSHTFSVRLLTHFHTYPPNTPSSYTISHLRNNPPSADTRSHHSFR